MAQAKGAFAPIQRLNQPIRFNANREVAERVVARIERTRELLAERWRWINPIILVLREAVLGD